MTRDQLRKQAQDHAQKLAQTAQRKEAQLRTDHNIIDAIEDLETHIKYRQHIQRAARVFVKPAPEEISAAKRLNVCILEVYAVGVSHE